MTPEERDIIGQFVARVSGGARSAVASFTGSVPATTGPALPPIDPEADRFLDGLFTQYPEARYRITQTAFVHEMALAEAQKRIERLEGEVAQLRQAVQQNQGGGRGFLGGLFGGPRPAPSYQPPPPPPPAYGRPGYGAPGYGAAGYGYAPGAFSGGSGFLGSALTTAAGVAGGVLAANAITSLFSGPSHSSPWGAAPGFAPDAMTGGFAGGAAEADPWATATTAGDLAGGDTGGADWGAAGGDGGGDWGGDGGGDWGGGDDSSFA